MARRYCAVYRCIHSEAKMKLWKDETCEEHEGFTHADCPCLQPYKLHRFPLKNKDLLRQWVKNINLARFKPTHNSRVCSIHFVDGMPTEDNPAPQLHMGYNLKIAKPRKKIVKHPWSPPKKIQVQRFNLELPNGSHKTPFTIPGNWETVTIKQEPLCYMDSEDIGQASESILGSGFGDDPLNLNSPGGTVTVKCEPILEEVLLQPKNELDSELNSNLLDDTITVKCEPMLEEELLQPKYEFDSELNSKLLDDTVTVKCEPILEEEPEEQLQPESETMGVGEKLIVTPSIVSPELCNNQSTPPFLSSNAVYEAVNNPAQHSTMATEAFHAAKDFRVEVTYKAMHHTDRKFQYFQCPQCRLFFNSLMLLQEHMVGNSSEVKRKPNSELKCGFICNVCNKRFAVSKALNMHHLIHNEALTNINGLTQDDREDNSEGNKTLVALVAFKSGVMCQICRQTLINQEALNKHMILHSQFKPFQCKKCEEKFGFETELTTHAKIHEIPKTCQGNFICKFCPKTFKVFQSIKKHMESAHNENLYKLYSITKFNN